MKKLILTVLITTALFSVSHAITVAQLDSKTYRITFNNGDIYVGELFEGRFHGHGTYYHKKTGNKYVGEWKNGKRHGSGILYWAIGSKHEGTWENGKIQGYGVRTKRDGTKIEANWVDGIPINVPFTSLH